jgi:Xaa-Pro aminopeptidase
MTSKLATAARTPLGEASRAPAPLQFDSERLDELLDEEGIDVLIASSKHNIQYLLGGYRFFFFDTQDAAGLSRYLPLFIYFKGEPERTVYIGNRMETWERDLGTIRAPEIDASSWGSEDAMRRAVSHMPTAAGKKLRIGVERAFLPADAESVLREALPQAEIVDALLPLERLRAQKSEAELQFLREASERVVDSMLAVIAAYGAGSTKREIAEALRREEVLRGLTFDYCLIAAGASHNRAPSDQVWREGEVLSVDSGGNYQGYIGDLARMAVLGEPDQELLDLLAEVDVIQQATRRPIRAGVMGREVYAAAEAAIRTAPHQREIHFAAHGMGLIPHEAPRLSTRAPVPYAAEGAEKPLETGMVISIETAIHHPRRGFIKLEDTVAVTATGWEAFGDHGRGWNRGGTKLPN